MSNATPEQKLKAALVAAIERLPEAADSADAALVVARVVRLHRRADAGRIVELAWRALASLEVQS